MNRARARFSFPTATWPFALTVLACASFLAQSKIALAETPFGPPPNPFVIEAIARTYAKAAVDRGQAIGVGVAILVGSRPPVYFTYGLADVATKARFDRNQAFQIGSVTKVFTTNLLGQKIIDGTLSLDTPLSSFPTELGSFDPKTLTRNITLRFLADFTSGLPDTAPVCKDIKKCMPNKRPTIQQYTANDFLDYIKRVELKSYQTTYVPNPLVRLPAPYNYSDFSVGLLGLILGADPKTSLSNAALAGWAGLLNKQLLQPLGMTNTFLPPLPNGRPKSCGEAGKVGCKTRGAITGYELATADVDGVSSSGGVQSIGVGQGGGRYSSSSPPGVWIVGGGKDGKGAQAKAVLNCTLADAGSSTGADCSVGGVTVVNPGTGYIPPPRIMLSTCSPQPSNGCWAQTSCGAKATPIVSRGKIIGATIDEPGEYGLFKTAPLVTVCNGREKGPKDRDASAKAHIANGQLAFISIEDGGSGYVDPLSVKIDPGAPVDNTVPIWAPAGALQSTLEDMSVFVAAALGRPVAGMRYVKPEIRAAFRLAQQPYACQYGSQDRFPSCVKSPKSGLSWAYFPGDGSMAYPPLVAKNGSLPGFSTQVDLMPSEGLGVVVFVNSFHEVAEAEVIAKNIINALHYTISRPPWRIVP